jgi:hypothetical protein
MRRLRALVLPVGCAIGGCFAGGTPPPHVPGELHAAVAPAADPTLEGPTLVPVSLEVERTYGVEPGGGVRAIASGVRLVNLPQGGVRAAAQKLPQMPQDVVVVPRRMGGGVFYLLGNTVWRSDGWLDAARPAFQASVGVKGIFAGLDRVYVRLQNGAHAALEPATGRPTDLGAWPGSSFVGPYAAADGWRAAAIIDLRGAVATSDAGASWRALALPAEPREVRVHDGALLVAGLERGKMQWFEVQSEGGFVRVDPPPPSEGEGDRSSALQRRLGQRPLAAAVEDGWPLADGSLIVARDGALARLRRDGTLLELVEDAFPMRPARCHPVRFGQAPGAIAFVCGEPAGKTVVYALEGARLRSVVALDRPRKVSASGNGWLVVEGGCDADAPPDDPREPTRQVCVIAPDGTLRPISLAIKSCVRKEGGACVEYARDQHVIALANGGLAILAPPNAADPSYIGTAQLIVRPPDGGGPPIARPIRVAQTDQTTTAVVRTLRHGMWTAGFEERRPGVLGGWIELGGSLLGVELRVDDGTLVHGALLREAAAMVASSRWGIAWGGSRRGFQTTNGGMTWDPVDLPDPIGQPRAATTRACGPVGCMVAGWLRVGWGKGDDTDVGTAPAMLTPSAVRPPSLALDCDVAGKPTAPNVYVAPPAVERFPGGGPWRRPSPRFTRDWQPLFGVPAPKLGEADLGYSAEAQDAARNAGVLGRFYAWGPREGEWEPTSKWLVRWLWPYGGGGEVRSTPPSSVPRVVADASGFTASAMLGGTRPAAWTFHTADDGLHGLIVARYQSPSGTLEFVPVELEADRPAVEVRRADGEPFVEIEAALRTGGRWYLATAGAGGASSTTIWEVEGGLARELVRVPRAALDGAKPALRLARRVDGRSLGVVVDGQPSADRSVAQRWIAPVDLETGTIGAPEHVGSSDFGGVSLAPCRGDERGWIADVPLPGTATVSSRGRSTALRQMLARVRLSSGAACLERLSGAGDLLAEDGDEDGGPRPRPRPGVQAPPPSASPETPRLEVSVLSSSRVRQLLRCTLGAR